jgi:hypothetical protein
MKLVEQRWDDQTPGIVHFRDADAVVGIDLVDDRRAIFYGRETIREAASDPDTRLKVIHVVLDFDTNQVETLAAICDVLKGSHCFGTEG